jgi:hypothetical protein
MLLYFLKSGIAMALFYGIYRIFRDLLIRALASAMQQVLDFILLGIYLQGSYT